MFVAYGIELQPDTEAAECDHCYKRETGSDDKSEFRNEHERSDRCCQGNCGKNLAAHSRSNRVARNTQERMRIRRRGLNHDVLPATEPEDHGGDKHERAW